MDGVITLSNWTLCLFLHFLWAVSALNWHFAPWSVHPSPRSVNFAPIGVFLTLWCGCGVVRMLQTVKLSSLPVDNKCTCTFTAKYPTRRSASVDLMLGTRRRRWSNIKTMLAQCLAYYQYFKPNDIVSGLCPASNFCLKRRLVNVAAAQNPNSSQIRCIIHVYVCHPLP